MKTRACALALLAPLLLTACGTTDTGAADEQSSSPSGSSDRAKATSASCAADRTKTATGPVTVKDDLGRTVSLKAPAQRVVSLEWQQTEGLLTLCTPPVAVADAKGYRTWVTAEKLPDGVKDVGTRQEPSAEAILAAKPDLVVVEASKPDDARITAMKKYGIPVLVTQGADVKDPVGKMLKTFDLLARATGRQDRARTVSGEFQRSTSAARQKITAAPRSRSFLYLDGWIEGGNVALRPFGQGSLVGELGESIGLKNAWTGKVDGEYGLGQTDVEGLRKVGDATLLRTGTKDPDGDVNAALAKNPVWKSVPAVKSGRSHAFPPGVWTFGGVRSSEQVLAAFVAQMTR